MNTIDLRSVSMSGARNHSRLRVLWRDGVLRAYAKTGRVLELAAQRPVARVGYVRSWDVETEIGKVTLRGKCMTCGGKEWWRVLWKSSDELWET